MKKEALDMAKKAYEIEANAILLTAENMDWVAFAKAVEILSVAERIAVSGCGHSGIACQHFAHSLCCIERPARFIYPSEAAHGSTGFMQIGDVLVTASRGGRTSELVPIIEIAHKKKASVISVTEDLESKIAQMSDIVLPMNVPLETDRYNTQGTSSFVALSSVFDALQTALIEETGFTTLQFALTHPGGAVGERLNSK